MATPCGTRFSAASDGAITPEEGDQLVMRARRLYQRELELGFNSDMAMQRVESRLMNEAKTMDLISERNRLLALQAKRNAKERIRGHLTLGDGLLSLLEGSSRLVRGARYSVDYQQKANFGKYFGRLLATLDEGDVTKDFMRGAHQLDIYRELWELGRDDGSPGRTGNLPAQKIARAIHDVGREMVARQNAAGAYIRLLPGYVMRQTHDIDAIRALGPDQSSSYRQWRDFVRPLLDDDATFEGLDPELVLRNVHQGIYSGIHGPEPDMSQVAAVPHKGSHASKVSQERILHFKDADSAYAYNMRFGMKTLRDQVVADIRFRARSVTLMETFGPSPKALFEVLHQELQAEARNSEDAVTQLASLSSWRIEAAFNEVSGHNDHPVNHTLARVMNNVRVWTMLSKMGGVVLSSFGDKAFMHAEMAYQGISQLQTLGKQITTLFKRSPEELRALRLMGAALDGVLGNVMGRFSQFHQLSGALHSVQKRFFDLNFMNWWNDANKAAVAELMSAHLGEHAGDAFDKLPMELSRVLGQYDIGAAEWDLIRDTAWEVNDGIRYLSPDRIMTATVDAADRILAERKLPQTRMNREKVLRDVETKLRTYLVDRTEYAVPSPGVAETRLATLNTRAGTPVGEAVRLIMMFKSFPITILQKIGGRELFGRGANTFMEWLAHDHRGKFNVAQIIAFSTMLGYLSGVVKDMLKGRKPKPLVRDGSIVWKTLNDAALRGGGLGILGDVLFNSYDRQYRSFLATAAGPVVGQLDPLAEIATMAKSGENVAHETTKFVQNNVPLINLFYIRPVLDYFVLWNLQEAMNPGSLRRMERKLEDEGQDFFVKPSEVAQ
jgi:hypothetical protein